MSALLKRRPRGRVEGLLDYLTLAVEQLVGRRPSPAPPPEPRRDAPPRPTAGAARAHRGRRTFGRRA